MTQNNHAGADIILASASRYRASLLHQLGIHFTQQAAHIDEAPRDDEDPRHLAARLAMEKAQKIACLHPRALVIGSDQVACLEGQLLHKPVTMDNARRQLTACSGKTVHFYTALYVTDPEHPASSVIDEVEVQFRNLSQDQIERYLQQDLPLDCAGSFKVEGLGISLFEKITAKDYNALIGLPLIELTTLLNQRGIAIP